MDKGIVIYIYIYMDVYIMKYYSALKKKEILPSVTMWKNLEDIMLREISPTQKGKYCMISHLYVESKKKVEPREIIEQWCPGPVGWGKWGDVGQSV